MLRPPGPTRLILHNQDPSTLWVPGRPDEPSPPPRTDEEIADYLEHGEIVKVQEPTTVEATFHEPAVATYADGTQAIVKSGNHLGPWGEAAIRAEATAYRVDRAIRLNAVPVTVIRNHGGERISCQHYIDATDTGHLEHVPKEEIVRAAAFDLAIGQLDREGKNWLLTKTDPPHLVLIDHGHAFDPPGNLLDNDGDPAQVRSDVVKFAKALGGPDFSILDPLEDPKVFAQVTELLSDAQVAGLIKRLAHLRAAA